MGVITVTVTAANLASVIATVGTDTTLLFQRGKTYQINTPIKITGKNVRLGATGTGNKPVIVAGDNVKYIVDISGSADTVAVEDLVLTSTRTTWGKGPTGINLVGRNVACRRNTFGHVHYGHNLSDKARNITIEDNDTRDGQVQGYFVYAKGQNITVRRNRLLKGGWAFVRCNLVDGLYIEENVTVGTGNMLGSRITIQKGNNIRIRGNRLVDTGLSVGPLGNCDGLRGEGSVEKFLAARTSNVEIANNRFEGGPKYEFFILARCVNVRVSGNNRKVNKFEKGKTITCSSQTIALPNPKDVWIDGQKVA